MSYWWLLPIVPMGLIAVGLSWSKFVIWRALVRNGASKHHVEA